MIDIKYKILGEIIPGVYFVCYNDFLTVLASANKGMSGEVSINGFHMPTPAIPIVGGHRSTSKLSFMRVFKTDD